MLFNEECVIEGFGGDEGCVYSCDDKFKVKFCNVFLMYVDDFY